MQGIRTVVLYWRNRWNGRVTFPIGWQSESHDHILQRKFTFVNDMMYLRCIPDRPNSFVGLQMAMQVGNFTSRQIIQRYPFLGVLVSRSTFYPNSSSIQRSILYLEIPRQKAMNPNGGTTHWVTLPHRGSISLDLANNKSDNEIGDGDFLCPTGRMRPWIPIHRIERAGHWEPND